MEVVVPPNVVATVVTERRPQRPHRVKKKNATTGSVRLPNNLTNGRLKCLEISESVVVESFR